jgi:hypothetical protein
MDPTDKDISPPEPAQELVELTVSRSVRWLPSDLERVERAAQVLGARERIPMSAADIIRRGALKEADEILSAA